MKNISKGCSNVKYNNSFKGRLIRMHADMRDRSREKGWELFISQEEFITFGVNNGQYQLLYKQWIESNYSYGLTPSIDRIDNTLGYIADNIQFLTVTDNTIKGQYERPNAIGYRPRPVKISNDKQELCFPSIGACSRYLSISERKVSACVTKSDIINGWLIQAA